MGDTEFLDPQGLREKGAMREGCPQASLGDSTLQVTDFLSATLFGVARGLSFNTVATQLNLRYY